MPNPQSPSELPKSLGALRASGWRSRSVRDEVRVNLLEALRERRELFPGVIGYDQTVVPQVVNALLSRHDLILLGLRGQAKTRIARGISALLDEWIPVLADSPIHEDPTAPCCPDRGARGRAGRGHARRWLHRSERYQKSSPLRDITMADLIGDLDPIKAATEQRSLMDPEVIQFGLLPQHQPRDLRRQRAARPSDPRPGGAVQHPRGEGRPDPRFPAADAARPFAGLHRQSGGLHQPRQHRDPAA